MESPKNGLYIILGEVNYIITALKRNQLTRHNHHNHNNHNLIEQQQIQDPLIRNFIELKSILTQINVNLNDIDSSTYLVPFLEVIKSEETNGPITLIALTSLDKFISYGLIDINSETISLNVQQISDAVTHARFVGSDTSNDEVVLMKILYVLRSLMLNSIGIYLTNSSICEIMQSCFQIYFESRLGELLRKTAELILIDMIQLLFARLPQFKNDSQRNISSITKKLTMKKTSSNKNNSNNKQNSDYDSAIESESLQFTNDDTQSIKTTTTTTTTSNENTNIVDELLSNTCTTTTTTPTNDESNGSQEFINPRGVRFVQETITNNSSISNTNNATTSTTTSIPYGIPCIKELLRFLISLINIKQSETMIHMGLNLIIVALESGVDHLAMYSSLLVYVKDDLCKNLLNHLSNERLSIYSLALRALFLIFESLRIHLKLQLEYFIIKLMEIIVSDSQKITYEHKEIVLDYIVQLLKIPGFAVELYLNYDCCLNCTNLFEDLTKLLSKNAFPVQGLYSTNSLSLTALLTVIENIEFENTLLNNYEKEKNDLSLKLLNTTTRPVSSGYNMAQAIKLNDIKINNYKPKNSSSTINSLINRFKDDLQQQQQQQQISNEDLKRIRLKKRLIMQSVELFNQNPSKGVQFLKDNSLIQTDDDLVKYLKQTSSLDKKAIGEYISKRTNVTILNSFIKSFTFENIRLDEALRIFLETFRLPGEAPLISLVLEQFATHYRQSNLENTKFANDDAVFTLAYAIIMLNVDQHNHNVKKQNIPMTVDDFKKNLSKVNGNENFDDELLEDIYKSIKNEEIVMPAEHTGQVRDNYLWKMLIRRSSSSSSSSSSNEDIIYLNCTLGTLYNLDIFNLIWGQTIAALSFVYDKSFDLNTLQKSINGFKRCAQIAAYYMMNDVFDNIIISLCKFTTLLNISNNDNYEQIQIQFGINNKAQLACRTVFQLTHSNGDILRDGWKNIFDCIIQLFKAKLLPRVLLECEDYLNTNGRIYLQHKDDSLTNMNNTTTRNNESNSLFSFFPLFSQDNSLIKGPTQEEQESMKNAQSCIDECHLEQLIHDTKFLRVDSLLELIKSLIFLSQPIIDMNTINDDESSIVFILELLIKVVLQNRDRISCIWLAIRNHLFNIISNTQEYTYLIERAIIGLIRISTRLIRREEISFEVLSSLRMLLLVKPQLIPKLCQHVTYGLHDLLRTNATNIHTNDDWLTIFTILQVMGAGATPPSIITNQLDDKESSNVSPQAPSSPSFELNQHYLNHELVHKNEWILVDKEDFHQNMYKIDLNELSLDRYDRKAFYKCCEILSFLIRDMAHITSNNYETCVVCLRKFIEANVTIYQLKQAKKELSVPITTTNNKKTKGKNVKIKTAVSSDDEETTILSSYETTSLQLLDLLDTLYAKATSVYPEWIINDKSTMTDDNISLIWSKCWCPILQGIARLSCDLNGDVRMHALQYLQRSLLFNDLQTTLKAIEWESCFNKVLFPLLAKLLDNIDPLNTTKMEETRMRASTLLCKVFLQHLTTLCSLSTFTALWLTILDYMDKYMKSDKSDLLRDVIPESLKNMLLVMQTTGLFNNEQDQLCIVTRDRIESFLPGLWDDLLKPKNDEQVTKVVEEVVETAHADDKQEQVSELKEEVELTTPQITNQIQDL